MLSLLLTLNKCRAQSKARIPPSDPGYAALLCCHGLALVGQEWTIRKDSLEEVPQRPRIKRTRGLKRTADRKHTWR